MPEISIVIPSYNHARYIKKAVDSVLNQSIDDLELIVVDDGSSDDTLNILGGFSDPRLKVFSQENQGAHTAINRGLNLSVGKYLAILNSDDYYHPKRLEKTVNALKANPKAGLASTYIEIVNEKDHTIGVKHGYQDSEPWLLKHPERSFRASGRLKDVLLTENYLATTSNYVISRPSFEKTGGFRPLRFAHDWDYALRVSAGADLLLLPELLLSYRIHPQNTIRKDREAMIFEICWILAVHLPDAVREVGFWEGEPPEKRLDQLLNSIYTYNCDRILNALLLMRLNENHQLALDLLEPTNGVRQQLLASIREETSRQNLQSRYEIKTLRLTWAERLIHLTKKFLGRL